MSDTAITPQETVPVTSPEADVPATPATPADSTPTATTEDEQKAKVKEYLDRIKYTNEKYGFDIGAKLEITENGIRPVPVVIKLEKDASQS